MIRVLICDDQEVVREGLQTILRTAPQIRVVGAARDGAEAVELAATLQPDVVLMDLKMPGMNGIQAIRVLSERFPGIAAVALTTYEADEWVFDAIRSGARGYVLKDTPREGLIQAIEQAAAGKTPVDPSVAGKLFAHIAGAAPAAPSSQLTEALSERELDVLRLLAHGLNNADIAARLYLSEGTVRNYVTAILSKLNVDDRTQAAILALRYGLADWPESPAPIKSRKP